MVEISEVIEGSIADEMGITAGDKLLLIDENEINDYIDFQYGVAEDFFVLSIEKNDGQLWEVEISRSPEEELGIILEGIIYDKLKSCKNNCLFCFVKQQPGGMRRTLCLKDDDYRFSFLQGSFITLTNISSDEIKRIIRLNLSPLYISVHTTNPELRVRMMKNPRAAKIMEQLQLLADSGINFHTQIVLCPGYNDGKELDRTISDLSSLYPSILSIGVVPVGLTDFREKLSILERYKYYGAREILEQISKWQGKLRKKYRKNFLYASDEFYFLAEKKLPDYEHYNQFPQIENGIGLTRLFREEFSGINLPNKINKKTVGIITGVLGKKALKPIINRLKEIKNLTISTIPVVNNFFGQSVTVTGLLTGKDIIKTLEKLNSNYDLIILPGIIFNNDGYLLDDLTLDDIKRVFPEKKFYIAEDILDIMEVLING